MARHKQIKTIDKTACKTLRDEMNKVLEPLGKKLGVVIKTGNASYDGGGNYATFKVNINTVSKDGNVVTKEASAFINNAVYYGLKPEHLNQTFSDWNGEKFEIVGLATRSHKYPILAKNNMGKTFKFESEMVKTKLGV